MVERLVVSAASLQSDYASMLVCDSLAPRLVSEVYCITTGYGQASGVRSSDHASKLVDGAGPGGLPEMMTAFSKPED